MTSFQLAGALLVLCSRYVLCCNFSLFALDCTAVFNYRAIFVFVLFVRDMIESY